MIKPNHNIVTKNTDPNENEADDFDGSWKEALNLYLYQCLDLLAPNIFELIDTTVNPEFLDKELQSIFRKSKHGRRIADKLVKVQLKTGDNTLLLIHIEVESKVNNCELQSSFAKRMYEYYVLIQHYFAKNKIYSLGILLNSTGLARSLFQDSVNGIDYLQYSADIFGNKLIYSFQVIHLAKWLSKTKQLELLAENNPFAIIVLAQLSALNAKPNRLDPKINMVRILGKYGYDKQTRRQLFNLIDWIIKLPKDLQPQFLESIADKDKKAMEYVNSFVRYGMEKGLEKGMAKGQISGQIIILLSMLEHKFDNVPEDIKARLNQATAEQIKNWSIKLIDAKTLDDVFD